MNRSPQARYIGSQLVLESYDIGPPAYTLSDTDIEMTIDELLDRAVEIGEQVSQGNINAGRGPAPYAHQACTAYHAIEAIRFLQAKLEELQERYDNALLELNGDDA